MLLDQEDRHHDRPNSRSRPATETEPRGELCTRTLAMPADTNAERRHFRRLAAEPDGHRRRCLRLQDREVAHGDGCDRGDEFPQTGLCRRSRLRACQSGPHRQHLDHGASRSLGDAPQGKAVRSSSPTAISPTSRSTIRASRGKSPRPGGRLRHSRHSQQACLLNRNGLRRQPPIRRSDIAFSSEVDAVCRRKRVRSKNALGAQPRPILVANVKTMSISCWYDRERFPPLPVIGAAFRAGRMRVGHVEDLYYRSRFCIAGIVVRDRAGFRFFSASRRFCSLDGKLFRSAREAERAAMKCAQLRKPRRRSRRGKFAVACTTADRFEMWPATLVAPAGRAPRALCWHHAFRSNRSGKSRAVALAHITQI